MRARQSLTICYFKKLCKSPQSYGFLCLSRTCLSVSWPCCLAVKNYMFVSNSFGMELLSESEQHNEHWFLSHSIWGCEIREAWSVLELPQRKIQNNPSPKLDFVIVFVMPLSCVFNQISPLKRRLDCTFYAPCRDAYVDLKLYRYFCFVMCS